MAGMEMSEQARKAERLRELHHGDRILVLPNIWDAGGTRMMEWLGYPAVATASAAIAYSLGYDDGQRITLDAMVEVVGRVASAVRVPVTADMEWGFAEQPGAVAANMRRVLRAGAVGINLEDSIREGEVLFPIEFQCERIRAVREMARQEGVPLVINARTDVFLTGAGGVDEALERGRAYAEAGADCLFAIGAREPAAIAALVEQLPIPVSVLARPQGPSIGELAELGVARISFGPGPMGIALAALQRAAEGILAREDLLPDLAFRPPT